MLDCNVVCGAAVLPISVVGLDNRLDGEASALVVRLVAVFVDAGQVAAAAVAAEIQHSRLTATIMTSSPDRLRPHKCWTV